jgi:hypothetical protein
MRNGDLWPEIAGYSLTSKGSRYNLFSNPSRGRRCDTSKYRTALLVNDGMRLLCTLLMN